MSTHTLTGAEMPFLLAAMHFPPSPRAPWHWTGSASLVQCHQLYNVREKSRLLPSCSTLSLSNNQTRGVEGRWVTGNWQQEEPGVNPAHHL